MPRKISGWREKEWSTSITFLVTFWAQSQIEPNQAVDSSHEKVNIETQDSRFLLALNPIHKDMCLDNTSRSIKYNSNGKLNLISKRKVIICHKPELVSSLVI